MPEGHVLHRLAGALNQAFGQRPVAVGSPQGRFATEAARLDGSEFVVAEAFGKQLFCCFDVPDASVVQIHLGLIGSMRLEPLAAPHGAVRLRINDDQVAADLRGPQTCRLLTLEQAQAQVDRLGPDPIGRTESLAARSPLTARATPDDALAKVQRSNKSIGELLMDQGIAAGVGNIFRAEVLFRHRIDPALPGRQVDAATWQLIWDDLVVLMRRATGVGRIDTVEPDHAPEAMGRPAREDPHGGEVYVYRRAGQPCLVCGTLVATRVLAGRNLYWCPRCQGASSR